MIPPQPQIAQELAEKIRTRRARCGVVGLGYVGLPLAVELAQVGLEVTGFDIDQSKISQLNAGTSYIQDVPLIKEKPSRVETSPQASGIFPRIAPDGTTLHRASTGAPPYPSTGRWRPPKTRCVYLR